jgi:hypothetical protein
VRTPPALLLAVLGLAIVAGCGGGDDAGEEADAILRAYADHARTLSERWPGVGDGPTTAREAAAAQRPTIDDIGELAGRASDLAADADGDQAAALEHLAAGLAATRESLAARVELLGRDALWPLDFYCTDLRGVTAQVTDLGRAFDEVAAAFELDRVTNPLIRDGGTLTTIARCGDATSAAARPLAGPAGGLAEGSEERAERVRAALTELEAALGAFDSADPLVTEGRDALRARVQGDIEILEAATAFRPDPAKSDAENAKAFGDQHKALLERQVQASQAWQRVARRLVAAANRQLG